VKVPSMAAGMNGKGLAEVIKQAEELMKQGKYNAALEKYDAAQQVAPNNPLIKLGRAIAELGGSYYARAETHIRDAFAQNPAVMIGQYDLRNLLGEDRLQALVKDLRELANTDKKDPRPVFAVVYCIQHGERRYGGCIPGCRG
jgi:tetratricopeptide (TPR) repeat protein